VSTTALLTDRDLFDVRIIRRLGLTRADRKWPNEGQRTHFRVVASVQATIVCEVWAGVAKRPRELLPPNPQSTDSRKKQTTCQGVI
jgi:hypothetical protein